MLCWMLLVGTTGMLGICMRCYLFKGFIRFAIVSAGSRLNASSVGAKTVNGPLPLSVSSMTAALMAAEKVANSGVAAIAPVRSAASAATIKNSDVVAASIAVIGWAIILICFRQPGSGRRQT